MPPFVQLAGHHLHRVAVRVPADHPQRARLAVAGAVERPDVETTELPVKSEVAELPGVAELSINLDDLLGAISWGATILRVNLLSKGLRPHTPPLV